MGQKWLPKAACCARLASIRLVRIAFMNAFCGCYSGSCQDSCSSVSAAAAVVATLVVVPRHIRAKYPAFWLSKSDSS